MEIVRRLDTKRRIRIDSQKRGVMSDDVLLSIYDNGILMEPYDQFKADLPEFVTAHFDPENRIVLPMRFCMPLKIQLAVTLDYTPSGSILLRPMNLHCVVCGSNKKRLYTISQHPNTYICEDCCREKT